MQKLSLQQLSPQSTPQNKFLFQTNVDQHESPFLSPHNELFERHQYRVRSYKPQTTTDQGKFRYSQKQLPTGVVHENGNLCTRCKGQQERNALRLCPCLNIYYHILCILEYADMNPKMKLDLFRCQFCNNYFPLQVKEKLSMSNLSKREGIIFLLTLSLLFFFLVLEIVVLVIFAMDTVYKILIIILIVLETLILLVVSTRVYHYCYLIEYDIKEYKLGFDYNQNELETLAIKIAKQLQYKRAKRVIL